MWIQICCAFCLLSGIIGRPWYCEKHLAPDCGQFIDPVKVGYVRKLAYEQAIGGATELITLSVNPPVFLAKNFLSKPEADEFIAEAKRKGGWKDSGYSEDEEGAGP